MIAREKNCCFKSLNIQWIAGRRRPLVDASYNNYSLFFYVLNFVLFWILNCGARFALLYIQKLSVYGLLVVYNHSSYSFKIYSVYGLLVVESFNYYVQIYSMFGLLAVGSFNYSVQFHDRTFLPVQIGIIEFLYFIYFFL